MKQRDEKKYGRERQKKDEKNDVPSFLASSYHITVTVSRAEAYCVAAPSCCSLHPPSYSALWSLSHIHSLFLSLSSSFSPSFHFLTLSPAVACLVPYGAENCGPVDSIFPLAEPHRRNFRKRVIRGNSQLGRSSRMDRRTDGRADRRTEKPMERASKEKLKVMTGRIASSETLTAFFIAHPPEQLPIIIRDLHLRTGRFSFFVFSFFIKHAIVTM